MAANWTGGRSRSRTAKNIYDMIGTYQPNNTRENLQTFLGAAEIVLNVTSPRDSNKTTSGILPHNFATRSRKLQRPSPTDNKQRLEGSTNECEHFNPYTLWFLTDFRLLQVVLEGTEPSVVQPLGCGQPGKPIDIPLTWLLQSSDDLQGTTHSQHTNSTRWFWKIKERNVYEQTCF